MRIWVGIFLFDMMVSPLYLYRILYDCENLTLAVYTHETENELTKQKTPTRLSIMDNIRIYLDLRGKSNSKCGQSGGVHSCVAISVYTHDHNDWCLRTLGSVDNDLFVLTSCGFIPVDFSAVLFYTWTSSSHYEQRSSFTCFYLSITPAREVLRQRWWLRCYRYSSQGHKSTQAPFTATRWRTIERC